MMKTLAAKHDSPPSLRRSRPSPRGAPLQTRIPMILTLLLGGFAFFWPVFFSDGSTMDPAQAPLLFAFILPLALAVVLSELTNGELDVKALAMLGVLAAIGSVLRPLSAGVAGFDLVFFLFILAGRAFGASFGFALGTITLFASALLTSGVGPWLPYQMLASGAVGAFAGWLPKVKGKLELGILALYGVIAGFAFGWLMDLVFWPYSLGGQTELSFDASIGIWANLHRFILFNFATSMGWNLGRAIVNACLVLLIGAPLLRLFRRTSRRGFFITSENGSTNA